MGSEMRELDIIIDQDWFQLWKHSYYPPTRTDVRSITSLYSPHLIDGVEKFSNGTFTTAVTFGAFTNKNKKNCLILFSVFPPLSLNPNQVITNAKNLCCNYLNNSSLLIEGVSPSYMVVPSDEIRNPLISEIRKNKAEVMVQQFKYLDFGKTLDNLLKRALNRIAENRIYLMADPFDNNKLRNQDNGFMKTVLNYPEERSRGIVWCLTQAILFLEHRGYFQDKAEEKKINNRLMPYYGIDKV